MSKLVLKDITLEEYSRKKFDERHDKIVSDIAPRRLKRFRQCRRIVVKGHCDSGHQFYKPSMCRLRDLCPVDAMGFSQDQAQDAYEIMELRAMRFDGKPDRVWVGVWTLPRSCWKRIPNNDLKEFRECGKNTVERMFSEGGRYRLYYRIDSQFWHSSNPFLGWYPHLHIAISSIAYDTHERKYVRLNLFQNDLQLKEKSRLSQTWRKCFEEKYGKINSKYVNVWLNYREGKGRVMHWLRYSNRNPVSDVYKNLGRLIYHGTKSEKAWLKRLLIRPDHEKRGQWHGIASDGIKSRYLKMLNIDLPKQADRRKARRKKLCLSCGSEMHWGHLQEPLSTAMKESPDVKVLVYVKK